MDVEAQHPKTIGFRAQRNGGLIRQNSSATWNRFAEMLSKCHWSYPRADIVDTACGYNDQELEHELRGDGTWLQLATGCSPTSEVTLVHALLIEVADLTRDQLLERLDGLTALGFTLCQHHPKEPAWRLIIPLAKPVTVVKANAAHQKFFSERMTGGSIYNETEQDRWFPRPGCRDDLREFFDHFKVDGHFIDAEAVLADTQDWDGSPKVTRNPTGAIAPTPAANQSVWSTATDAAIRIQLETLHSSLKGAAHHETVGEQILEIEFELNRRQKWAPAFRPSAPIPRKASDRQPVHEMIQQMRVVIDCHWLHTQLQRRQPIKEAQWQALLDPTIPFPFELAKDFAARAIHGATRADEVLCLTPVQEAQLRSMCGKRMREARKKAEDVTSTGRSPLGQTLKAINQWAVSDPRVNVEKHAALARAQLLLNVFKHTNTDLGILVGFSLGEDPTPENRIRAMKANLTKALKNFS